MATELFHALETFDADRVAALLQTGADPNAMATDDTGMGPTQRTPLQAAIDALDDGGPVDALILLVRHGVRMNEWDSRRANRRLC